MKERAPVDELSQRREGKILEHSTPKKFGYRQLLRAPLDRRAPRARRLDRNPAPPRRRVRPAQRVIFRAILRHKLRAALVAQQARRYRHGPAGIEYVHYRLAVMRRNLHGRMRAAGGRAANQQRQLQPLPLHLPRHVHHLVK